MKRIFLFLFVLNVICTFVFAAPISEKEARNKALQFMLSRKGESSARSAQRSGTFGHAGANLTIAEAREAFYVFNVDTDKGYVIVSGDDRMPDVLGYSYSGTYNPEEIPDNMQSWLERYADQYEYMQTHNDVKGASITTVVGEEISPMLDCHWNQRSPYNDLCPIIDGQSTPTGCVATAMAQIMYYHKWPEQTLQSIPAYTTRTCGISMPQIEITTINWDNMSSHDIASLMLLCGCSIRMDYTPDLSGVSNSSDVEIAFWKYFGYKENTISRISPIGYNESTWNQMIYNELKFGRPVYYTGRSSKAGHAFVIDGYDGNGWFHVNWGWGGAKENFFLLSALNPDYGSDGYNDDQEVIIGIEHKYAYAELNGSTLTFYYDDYRDKRTGTILVNNAWTEDKYRDNIKTVIFDSSFRNFKKLTSTKQFFYNLTNLTSIKGIEYLNTQNVTDMTAMFYGCSSLTFIDLRNLKTKNVTNMSAMFGNCSNLTSLNIINFNTENVTDMSGMFMNCSNLTYFNVSNFKTKNVTNMLAMFFNCSGLTSLDLRNFNTENVTDMSGMFMNCSNLTYLNVSRFNTKKVTNMLSMFRNCSSLTSLYLSNFDTRNVTNMQYMFDGCSAIEYIYTSESWSTASVTAGNDTFYGCTNLVSETGTKYSPDKTDYTYANTNEGGYFTYRPSSPRGDANSDGKVDMDDVTFITNIILGTEAETEAADVNNDGIVNMPDAMFIVNKILNGKFPDEN